jgi:integrase
MAKLTAAFVEKARPDPNKRIELPDSYLPGLYLVIQPSGKKSWAARYRCAGKPRKLTVGQYPTLSLVEARDEARKALQQVQKGGDPAREKQIRRRQDEAGNDAFASAARLFIDRDQKPRNRTWRQAAWYLGLVPAKDDGELLAVKGGLADIWAQRKLADIRKSDIIAALDRDAQRAPIIANRRLSIVRRLFRWSLGRDMIAADPTAGIEPPSPEHVRDRVLSDDELPKVWRAAAELKWPFGPIVQLLILTGQRRDEVAGMHWSEIDLGAKLWTLPRGRVKNDSGHTVPLSAQAIAIIERLPRTKGVSLVFSTTGYTAVSGFSNAKEKLDAKLDAPDWRLHDLRRSVATGLQRLGVRLEVTEAVLNHVSGSRRGVVGVYQKYNFSEEKRAALDLWGRHVAGLAEPGRANVIALSARAM